MKWKSTYYLWIALLFFGNLNQIVAQSDDDIVPDISELIEKKYEEKESNTDFINPRKEYLEKPLDPHRFQEKIWQNTIQDIDYTNAREKDRDEAFDESLTNSNQTGSNSSSGFNFSSEFWSRFFKFLIIAAAVVTFAFLIINLMGGGSFFGPRNRKIKANKQQITIENLEDNILESDLDKFIRGATKKQNYALAIRLFYLAIIKELSLKKSIKWKRDKTNKDYLQEMRQNDLFSKFREATAVFERVWYGNITLTEQDYQNIKPTFQHLIQTIQTKASTKT